MAFQGPPELAPGLPREDGRSGAQMTIELNRLALRVLGILGVAIAGVDVLYINVGLVTVTAPAGGVFSIAFRTPFPKACVAVVGMSSVVSLKLLAPTASACAFQRSDGAAGTMLVSFIAVGC